MPNAAASTTAPAAGFDPFASLGYREYCAEERDFVLDLVARARAATDDPAADPRALTRAAGSLDRCGQAYAHMPPLLKGAWARACRAVAAHPNAPPDALLPLVRRHLADCADGLLANPSLPLLLLESPDLLAELRRNARLLRRRRAGASPLLALLDGRP